MHIYMNINYFRTPSLSINPNSDTLEFYMMNSYSNSEGISTTNCKVTFGRWTYIVGIINHNVMKLYCDGQLTDTYYSSSAFSWNTWSGKYFTVSNDWGRFYRAGDGSYINNLVWYNYELTSSQVSIAGGNIYLNVFTNKCAYSI